jgi:hypothetical protein
MAAAFDTAIDFPERLGSRSDELVQSTISVSGERVAKWEG